MKKSICIILSVLFLNHGIMMAQESETTQSHPTIGLSFSSFGENDVFRFEELEGAASYDGDHFFTLGINYVHPLSKWLDVETGLEYSKHNVIVWPNLPPDMDNSPRKADFSLINIPVTLRANFLKYFFINGGLFLDIDASLNSPIDSQTGLGALGGIAFNYHFKNGVSAFVNPYIKIHSLVPTSDIQYHQRVWENGIRFGVTYDLKQIQ